MLSLRRASIPLRTRGLGFQAASAACADLQRPVALIQDKAGFLGSVESGCKCNRCLSLNGFHRSKHDSANLFLARRGLASHAGAKSGGEEEDDLDDGFSELEVEDKAKAESDEELISEPEFSEDDDVPESDASKKVPIQKDSGLLKLVLSQGSSISGALNKWVEDGNKIDREESSFVMRRLRKFRNYRKALLFSEWLESSKTFEFIESDYSSRLDLIGKVNGVEKAERYVARIPESFRGELLYQTLLASCVPYLNYKKAEEIFSKIKKEFTITAFACNQMILLYKRNDYKKVADVLSLMEKENVKPSSFTYKMLIDIKGNVKDIAGMEQVLETMRAEGIEPDNSTQSIVAMHYAKAGQREKAEATAKQMEDCDLKGKRDVCPTMIQLYGEIGMADEVERVWKMCESNPWPGECIAAIEAWGKLKKIDKAEAVFEEMLKVVTRPSALHYNTLLKVYSNNKMLEKGKDLIKRMADNGCQIGPVTWDALVKLYVDAGEIAKADFVLVKAAQQKIMKPMFTSYMAVMDHYSSNGDVHNAEKIFQWMREAGYVPRIRQFHSLVRAYVNAKAPLYGIRERMKAENVYPTRSLSGELELVNAFRKSPASDLIQ